MAHQAASFIACVSSELALMTSSQRQCRSWGQAFAQLSSINSRVSPLTTRSSLASGSCASVGVGGRGMPSYCASMSFRFDSLLLCSRRRPLTLLTCTSQCGTQSQRRQLYGDVHAQLDSLIALISVGICSVQHLVSSSRNQRTCALPQCNGCVAVFIVLQGVHVMLA